jgi:hypothetical protein
MKLKNFVACALTASALPLAPAFGQVGPQPTGPQGTGAYGAANAALPARQVVAPAYTYATPMAEDSVSRGMTADTRSYDTRRDDERRMTRRGAYDGPSWATNPPAPAP